MDGRPVTRPSAAVSRGARVTVSGVELPPPANREYVLLHKPPGLITTRSDPSGRSTVMAAIPNELQHLAPVGRLDRQTSGALLFTNDGELALGLTHPDHGVAKTYVAVVEGSVEEPQLQRLREGVRLKDGHTLPAEADVIERCAHRSVVRLTIREGRKRQVRRMFRALGSRVIELVRTAIGPVELGDLPLGEWRRLTPAEVESLRSAVRDTPHSTPHIERSVTA